MTTQPLTPASIVPPEQQEIRHVPVSALFSWLMAGVRTFTAAPWYGLLFGALYSAACLGTIILIRKLPWFTFAFLTGLMIFGQILGAGLYTAAKQQAAGHPIKIASVLAHLRSRTSSLGLFALFLGLVMAVWIRFAALFFALMFTTLSPSINDILGIFSGTANPWVVGFFLLIGVALAAAIFITSAVAIPLIVDRNCGPVTAIAVSARAVAGSWPAMLLWAVTIITLTGIGILTAFTTMLVIFPVLSYATWHGYRALVAERSGDCGG